jgi:predicted MFS family arabinose efflux permease
VGAALNLIGRHLMNRAWTLALLTLIATLQFFDRALIVVVMEPIKQEFGLSDSQLGVLSGLSYAGAFALAGIPLGWLADRSRRRSLLALLLLAWSLLLGFSATAASFAALVASRIGIGAMDAGGQPCSVSMIADLYPRHQRSSAVAVFFAGVPLGMLLGFMAGGFIAGTWGWRAGFFAAAIPGVLLAAALLWVREPVRGATEPGGASPNQAAPSLRQALRFMVGQRSLLLIVAASVLVTASSSAMMSWIGALLVRVHGLSLPEAGVMMALCMGGVGAIGTVAAGMVADRLGARDMRWQPWLMAAGALLIAVLGSLVCMLESVAAVAVALGLFAACVAGLNGPTYALSQSLVPVRMRASSMSTLVVLLNLIGVGVGPTLAGVLSDVFAGAFGADSVRWAMACVLALNLPAVALFARAARSIRDDLVRAGSAG